MDPSQFPDLRAGVDIRDISDGAILSGRIDSEKAILVRRGEEFFAVGAECTHYHGALGDGLAVADTIRCPLHHACFSLRTGAALRAPALDPIACWRVERVGSKVFVRERKPDPSPPALTGGELPASVIIIGGGAAGLAAADRLRREGYAGSITMISADSAPPYDRPNLSKDFLMGTAPAEWIPLRSADDYAARKIKVHLNSRVQSLDLKQRSLRLEDGQKFSFDALLLATGADPVRLNIPASGGARLMYLRTFADSQAIVAAAASAKRVVVLGASFIGLEVAASLRHRGIEVHVVGLEHVLFERVLGAELGALVRNVHEDHGVVFHLGASIASIAGVDGRRVALTDGSSIEADFVVVGVGVRPTIMLAEQSGLAIDRGVLVNEFLETSATGVFAAGDIARWPDPHSGKRIRVEHWVIAERQGQVAALNILGRKQAFDAVPFFWSQHYDLTINYVGHAETWDAIDIEGSLKSRNCTLSYKRGGRLLAVASISRDLESLEAERNLEQSKVST
jgi:apoptosis-inducing factor 3